MQEEQKRKLLEFCSNPANAKIAEFIKKGTFNTSTGELILTGETGEKVVCKIDDLNSGIIDFSTLFKTEEIKQETPVVEEPEVIEEISEEPVVENQNAEIEEILDENVEATITNPTLYDFNNAVQEKNIEKVDSMLATFAVNVNTGLVDVDRAVKVATSTTFNEAIKCVQNNTNFSTDLSHYDITGKSIVKQDELASPVNAQDICDKSFENILVHVRAAKLKGVIYDEEKQAKAKVSYTTLFNDRLNVMGLNKNIEEPKKEEVVEEKEENTVQFAMQPSKKKELALRPTTDIRKAGFADVFILTAIVIVYTVIIVNLIMKLS